MLAPRKRPLHLLIALSLLAFLLFVYRQSAHDLYAQLPSFPGLKSIADNAPANTTLGFGALVVVSKSGSSRRAGLLKAANVTDIELTIPTQPQWTEDDVNKFRSSEDSKMGRGSIYAWLGHHNALRWFLDSGLETALILEDDVDWDIQLRSVQVPLAATAVRSMLPPLRAPLSQSFSNPNLNPPSPQYWGDTTSWDLLYLGHCGDYFSSIDAGIGPGHHYPENLTSIPHKLYPDPSLPSRNDLHPFTASLFTAFNLPEHTRILHRSMFPLCTFGYAVTRPAAERLLSDLAPAKEPPQGIKDVARAFDVAILNACRKGAKTPSPTDPKTNPHPHPDPKQRGRYASAGLRCWTVNSELFHHMPGGSLIAQLEAEVKNFVGIPPVDAVGAEQVVARNETSNIGCGFWNGAFEFEEGDSERLAWLREEVGRKGRCLKVGRDGV
ncbi:glycosyltransferase family 25 protein [Lepidopterella palustris CBS 459.81]|uniref:Glycosyltransferase family 25 protein n=1 Tax=Lepidopterella palustris CBS 459.81 TaxID=1314670 RepID=A0A8E2EHZ4_9PEZI|nr:glycosyltransferase family 25 protein [Lepidopterella palustris CBS 459.81]